MSESTTVTVGLDVHARSIRLAAVRADELLEEQTLPHDAGRAAAAALARRALLPRGGPDRARALPASGRARHRLQRGRAGVGAAAAGRSGEDRSAGRTQ